MSGVVAELTLSSQS